MKTYKSKVDLWLICFIIGGVVAFPLGITLIIGEGFWPMFALCGLMLAFISWSYFVTRYEVDSESLYIHGGFFKLHIPIDMITSVKNTRYSISSPAWSLDRLEIIYGNNKNVLISPKNKAGFLSDIGWIEKLSAKS